MSLVLLIIVHSIPTTTRVERKKETHKEIFENEISQGNFENETINLLQSFDPIFLHYPYMMLSHKYLVSEVKSLTLQ